jgi:hypothetical protein
MRNVLKAPYYFVLLREKLCPNLPENVSRLYRYDRVTKKCYRGGDKGPCGENMLFYGEAGNKVYGICDCDVLNKERALIFRGDPDSCHFVFTQVDMPKLFLLIKGAGTAKSI